MTKGERGLLQDFEERLHTAARSTEMNPDLTRRQVVGGLIGITLAQGIGLAAWRSEHWQEGAANGGYQEIGRACPTELSLCQHDVLADGTLASSDVGVANSEPGSAQSLMQPFQFPAEITQPIPETGSEAAASEQAQLHACHYETLSSQECIVPGRPPTAIPFQRVDTANPADVEQINGLLGAIQISPERYHKFKIDTSRAFSLEGVLSREPVWPSVSVNHWVGYTELTDNIDEYIDRMQRSRLSYHTVTMANGLMHQIAPSPHDLISHAKYANWDSIGQAANANSLATLTPEMMEAMIYGELYFDKEYRRVLTRENSRSHAEVVRHDNVTKVDWPSQLQDGFYHLKLTLNHLVYVDGKGGHPSPYSA